MVKVQPSQSVFHTASLIYFVQSCFFESLMTPAIFDFITRVVIFISTLIFFQPLNSTTRFQLYSFCHKAHKINILTSCFYVCCTEWMLTGSLRVTFFARQHYPCHSTFCKQKLCSLSNTILYSI